MAKKYNFNSNTPGRIDQFIKELHTLLDEYHPELYLKDGVYAGIEAVKIAALGEDTAQDETCRNGVAWG